MSPQTCSNCSWAQLTCSASRHRQGSQGNPDAQLPAQGAFTCRWSTKRARAPPPFSLRIPGTGGAWWASFYGVARSRTRLKRLSSSSSLKSLSSASVTSLSPLALAGKPLPGKELYYTRAFWFPRLLGGAESQSGSGCAHSPRPKR